MNLNKTNSARPIVILGAKGQLGRAFQELLKGQNVIAADRTQADLSRPQDCVDWINSVNPRVILNAAAYTQVDLAEKESELAKKINTETPARIAEWTQKHNVPWVHFSTDYVFSGEGTTPWKESDPVQPSNVYGRTKADGEKLITQIGGRYLIFRTSWVYDAKGRNFVNTMLRLGQEREELKVVSDQTGAPTYAPDLAWGSFQALSNALEKSDFPSGIYHLCNQGETTWFHFAQQIFELARQKKFPLKIKNLLPIDSSQFPTPAKRPKNSRMSTDKAATLLGVKLPEWEASLEQCLNLIQP